MHKKFGVKGFHIKGLKTQSQNLSPQKYKGQYVPISEGIINSNLKQFSGFSTPLNEMILVHANDSAIEGDVEETRKKARRKESLNVNSYRSKVSTDRNIYQSKYDDQSALNSLRERGRRTRINSSNFNDGKQTIIF